MGSSVEILGSRSIQDVLVGGCAPFASVAWSRLRRSLLSLKHAPDTIQYVSYQAGVQELKHTSRDVMQYWDLQTRRFQFPVRSKLCRLAWLAEKTSTCS